MNRKISSTRKCFLVTQILFQMMDSIADAVYQSCEPAIEPEIEPVTAHSKNLIVVSVSPGTKRPYYLKSKGKEAGTYIRVGSTTRSADPSKIKELELEGAKISWDELPCIGFKVTESAIEKLCNDMNLRRKKLQESRGNTESLPQVTVTNLENWKLITKNADGYTASNAFALLTSEHFQLAKTQCAVFKGTDRIVFLDKREYTGPLYEQIDEAVKFVLRNIRLGAEIRGLYRVESYELPVDAIREMIVNAHCHRNFNDDACVQVAVYDDRLEVTSPGGLYFGLNFEEAMNGHSKLRNRVIANVFCQMGLIEAWGTGLRRIKTLAKDFDLPVPEFIETTNFFRVNLFRRTLNDDVLKDAKKDDRKTGYKTSEKFLNTQENGSSFNSAEKDLAKSQNITGEISEELRNNCGECAVKPQRNFGEISEELRNNCGESAVKPHDNFGEVSEELRNNCGGTAVKPQKKIGETSEKTLDNPGKISDVSQNLFGETPENHQNESGENAVKSEDNFGETAAKSAKPRSVPRQSSDSVLNLPPDESDIKSNSQFQQLNSTQKKIVLLLKENPELTAELLAKQLDLSSRSIEYNIQKLKEFGLIVRHGSFKGGYWEVIL